MRCWLQRAFPAFILLLPAPALTDGIVIQHAAVGCVVAERFPRLEARFEPGERLGRARVHFRPEASRYWYSVAMTREGDVYQAVLPRPKRSLKAFSYYIEATDADFVTSRTQDYSPRVVGTPAECETRLIAAVASSVASVVVEAPAGAPAIPVGFASSGVTTVSAAGAAASAATAPAGTAGAAGAAGATGAAAGGTSTGLVLGVVGGALAVGGVAVAVTKGGGSTSPAPAASPTTSPSPGPSPTPTPTPAPIDLTGRWVGTAPDGAISSAGGCAGEQQDIVEVLTQTGSSLTGTYDGTIRVAGATPACLGVGNHELGTIVGTAGAGALSFTLTINQPPGIKDTAVTGTYTANRATGTFQSIGGNAAGTWAVNRQ